ncbi:DUF6575 domain-containing protein [Dyadobacter jiangsuensis]|uniref:DUF6575 domain-containing protein n=1 Tax=Dyadobacter jiangsuensis TaxID=1591085 RepID=A0A2P8FP10_9BACT|nr:DUF6575 domain-containing protein [Dyadobacter jiangsuensis]PSL23456.1 hypothetical protein CLV60_11611 [Dyadobacter jiangsuensis]
MLEDIDEKYRLEKLYPSLTVLEVLDFIDFPILTVESDEGGNKYLSYLVSMSEEEELRAILQVSSDRLNDVKSGNLSIHDAFHKAESNSVFIATFNLDNGDDTAAFLVPSYYFNNLGMINPGYAVSIKVQPAVVNPHELVGFAIRKNKVVLDIYLQSRNLVQNVKPYAIFNVVTPIVNIIKTFLSIDGRNQDKYLAFSNLRAASLGVTIEVNVSRDLFLERETREISLLISLLNSSTKEDLEYVIGRTRSDSHWKSFATIVNAVIKNDATLNASYANPITGEFRSTVLGVERAAILSQILQEQFDVIEDIEIIEGSFLEIDIDAAEPSFKVWNMEDNSVVKGRINADIVEVIKGDHINIGTDIYRFDIKVVYTPQTTTKKESTKYFLLSYQTVP